MADKIYIKDLLVPTMVGVDVWEREQIQGLLFNIELVIDLAKAGSSDRLQDTVDYQQVVERVCELVEKSRYRLLEKLANIIAKMLLTEFKHIEKVKIQVDKKVPVRRLNSVAVEIERTVKDF